MNSEENPSADSARQQEIEGLSDQFLDDLRTGNTPDRKALVDAHPELAPSLEERLKLLETIFQVSRILEVREAVSDEEATLSTHEAAHGGAIQPGGSSDRGVEHRGAAEPFVPPVAQRISCPHCGNQVQLVDLQTRELTCRSCGSSVSVDPEGLSARQAVEQPEIIGRFQIKRVLGQGAFGLVFLAYDPELDREVAIKVPRQGFFVRPGDEQRFFREAQSAAGLQHPGIVRVHEVSMAAETPYIVSEYIEGVTLADLIIGGELGFHDIATLMVKISEAVAYAHQQGVIHRDLKPSNILIDARRQPYVADFGLARREDAEFTMTLDGVILGTPAYMSPEQASSDSSSVNAVSDVYSLGVILYKLLCRELPFSGSKRMMLHQVLHEEPVRPRSLNPRIPLDLETITLKAMAKSGSERYASAEELLQELQRWLDGRPIQARRIGRGQRAWRWCRRNPADAGLLATIAGLLIIASILFGFQARRESSLRTLSEQITREAVEARQLSDRRLYELYEQNGLNAMHENRLIHAAWCFARSLELDDSPANQLRCALVMDRMPKLSAMFPSPDIVHAMRFSPGGDRLAITTQGGQVSVYQTATGEKIFEQTSDRPAILDLVFLDQGRLLAFPAGLNRIQIWDVDTRQLRDEVTHDQSQSRLAVNSDGSRLATGSLDANIRFWDVESGALETKLTNADQRLESIRFVPGSNRLVTVTYDLSVPNQPQALIRVFDPEPEPETLEFKLALSNPLHWDLSGDGSKLALKSDNGKIQVIDLANGQRLGDEIVENRDLTQIRLDRSGEHLLILADNQLSRHHLPTGKLSDRSLHLGAASGRPFFSDDRRLIYSVGNDGTAACYSTEHHAQVVSRLENLLHGSNIEFHPNGRQVAVEHADGLVRLWDLAGSAANALEFRHDNEIQDARFIPGTQRCVSVSRDHRAIIWDTQSGNAIAEMQHDDDILTCDASPDGKWIATAGADQTVRIWDSLTGLPQGLPLPHDDTVEQLVFSHDSRRVISGDNSGSVRCWRISPGQDAEPVPLYELTLPGNSDQSTNKTTKLALSPSGEHFSATSSGGGFGCWRIREGSAVSGPHLRPGAAFDCLFLDADRLLVVVENAVEVWDLDGNQPKQAFAENASVASVRFSTWNGQRWLFANLLSGDVEIYQESETGFDLVGFETHRDMPTVNFTDTHADRRIAVSAGGTGNSGRSGPSRGSVWIWDPHRSQPLAPPLQHDQEVLRARLAPQGDRVLTASEDGTSLLWNLEPPGLPVTDYADWLWLHIGSRKADNQAADPAAILESFANYQRRHPELTQADNLEIQYWNRASD